nr:hypothetical protein [Tanacetum cinerariifolium]
PEWSRHVTIVQQTKDLHTADYTQLYDFLKYNQKEMIRGEGGNQFRQYARQNVRNLNGYNAVQNVGNQVSQNPRVQNDGIQNQIGNDGSAEVHESCDNNEIFNMFTQEEQYTELLEPIPEPQ